MRLGDWSRRRGGRVRIAHLLPWLALERVFLSELFQTEESKSNESNVKLKQMDEETVTLKPDKGHRNLLYVVLV